MCFPSSSSSSSSRSAAISFGLVVCSHQSCRVHVCLCVHRGQTDRPPARWLSATSSNSWKAASLQALRVCVWLQQQAALAGCDAHTDAVHHSRCFHYPRCPRFADTARDEAVAWGRGMRRRSHLGGRID